MFSSAKKKLLLVSLFLFLFIIPSFVFGQNSPSGTDHGYNVGGTKITKDNYTDTVHSNRVFNSLFGHSLGCNLFGSSLLVNDSGKQLDCLDGGTLLAYQQLPDGGLLGGSMRMVAGLYEPSLSTSAYIAEVKKGFGFVDEAYAQTSGSGIPGSGNKVIEPILILWQFMRNFSYLIFTFIFVIIGVMIMLRQKINAQTFISIQSALPSLVIGLILVNFSYYLAALMVDAAFYGMYLVAFIFSMISSGPPQNEVFNIIRDPVSVAQTGSMMSLWWSTIWNSAGWYGIVVPLGSAFSNVADLGPAATPVNSLTFTPFDPFLGGNIVRTSLALVGGGLGIVITIIIGIAVIVQMLRLFWSLLQSYIAIMVQAVLGPIIITIGSFPGKGGMITNWWKTILGHALVFPAVFATFLFGGFFLYQATKDAPTLYSTSLPLITGLPYSMLPALIGFGIILGSTSVPGMVKKAVGVKDLGEVMSAAQDGFTLGTAGASVVGNVVASGAANYYYNLAKDKRKGTFHSLMAERMKNSWMNKRFGLERS